MTSRTAAATLLLLAAACATGRAKSASAPFPQAGQGLPDASELPEAEQVAFSAAQAHEAKGDASTPGEWAAAAAGYAGLAERPAAGAWRVPLRHRAAELFLRAQRWERAAEAAGAVVADAQANEASRAMAARLKATALLGAANAAVKAGQLEKLDLAPERKAAARPPPAAWKRVVEAADAYLGHADADPESKSPAERRSGVGPAELALVAAEVQYAYGEVDDARRRFEAILERWPSEPEVLEQAVPLYLATFLARGDRPGHDAAVERLRERIAAQSTRATEPAQKAAFAKALEGLSRARAGARFAAAEGLLAQGKAAEAAQAFEAVAAEPGAVDPANALHNAAVAWDQASDAARAAAVRERIVKHHADAPVAAEAAFRLAAFHSRKRDHLRAAGLYDELLRRWPASADRCLALRNVAAELDLAGRPGEAAARYLAFGTDGECAKGDPNVAARALVRAGRLFEAQAKAAYGGAVGLPGVTDPEAQGQVGEAKRRLKAP